MEDWRVLTSLIHQTKVEVCEHELLLQKQYMEDSPTRRYLLTRLTTAKERLEDLQEQLNVLMTGVIPVQNIETP
jgi:hypothetical protein